MAGAAVTNLPLGAEIIPIAAPTEGGAAPWEREGASHRAPQDPESRAKAERWKERAAEEGEDVSDTPANIEERRRRAERRKARKKEKEIIAEAKRVEALEKNARRMFLLGFFALPLLWLVSLFYFHKDYKSADPNPVIKKCSFCTPAPPIPFILTQPF